MKTPAKTPETTGHDQAPQAHVNTAGGLSAQDRALKRIRRISQPLKLLISIVFALTVVVPIFQIVVVLFLAHHLGSYRAFVSFGAGGVGLNVADADQQLHLRSLAQIPLDTLSLQQQLVVAALDGLCATCTALAVSHLRSLFVLYSRGVVFAEDNIRHIKSFGMWLVVAAIAINVAGRLFVWTTHAAIFGTSNAALMVVLGAMIYVIAYVMELGRQADLERKEFI
jgi:hypothetical protein